jgi:FkbM family methyltransferase
VVSQREQVRRLVRRLGFDVVRFRGDTSDFVQRLLASESIDLVADVGANSGQYGLRLRAQGYPGPILSFEPTRSAFQELERWAIQDRAWSCERLALGESSGTTVMHVSDNSVSSSLYEPTREHLAAAPSAAARRTEEVEIRRLDEVLPSSAQSIWLKIDTQGHEAKVLAGAGDTWPRLKVIQLELSLRPMYRGEPVLHEMVALMEDKGYVLTYLEPGLRDRHSGAMLQCDGIFVREEHASAAGRSEQVLDEAPG